MGLGNYDHRTGEGYIVGYEAGAIEASTQCVGLPPANSVNQATLFDDSFDKHKFVIAERSILFRYYDQGPFYDLSLGTADLTASPGIFFPKSINTGWHAGGAIGMSLYNEIKGNPITRLSLFGGYDIYRLSQRRCITKLECAKSKDVPDNHLLQYISIGVMIERID